MMNNSTEKVSTRELLSGFLETLKSGFLKKIGVWERLILWLKRRKFLTAEAP